MTGNLQRLMQKARAERPQAASADTLPIVGDGPWELPERIDRLIAAGKLAEADRERCVFWNEHPLRDGLLGTEQLAVLKAQYDLEKEKVPDVDAACTLVTAYVLHDFGTPPGGKSVLGDSL